MPRLGPFRARHPAIDIDVAIGTSSQVERGLIQNRFDIGILVSFSRKELFETRPCAIEECAVVAAKNYVRNNGPLDTYQQIVAADLLDFTNDFTCLSVWLRKNAHHLNNTLAG